MNKKTVLAEPVYEALKERIIDQQFPSRIVAMSFCEPRSW